MDSSSVTPIAESLVPDLFRALRFGPHRLVGRGVEPAHEVGRSSMHTAPPGLAQRTHATATCSGPAPSEAAAGSPPTGSSVARAHGHADVRGRPATRRP